MFPTYRIRGEQVGSVLLNMASTAEGLSLTKTDFLLWVIWLLPRESGDQLRVDSDCRGGTNQLSLQIIPTSDQMFSFVKP